MSKRRLLRELLSRDIAKEKIRNADLRGADLRGAYLHGADLRGADLQGADLQGADLRGADLRGADLRGADLQGADFNEGTFGLTINCPEEGEFIAYKKANNKIVVLKITETALRSSATSYKCRCSQAVPIRFEDLEGNILNVKEIASDYDPKFIYRIGELKEVTNFDTNRFNECSTGIHFFINKQMAINYN